MGDNFKKVQAGQPLKIPAETFNAFLDAARDFRARQQSRETQSQQTFRQSGIVKVKNSSGADRGRFEILGIDRPIFTPTDNLETFQNEVTLVGVTPDGEKHLGRFCVLLEPLKADAIGLAVIAGVCPVRVNVHEESDTFAEIKDGEATQLKSGGSGSATILWKESGTGENKWAVVRLGNPQPLIRKAEMIDTLRQARGQLMHLQQQMQQILGAIDRATNLHDAGLMAITSCAQANVAQEAANVGKSLASLGKLIGILNIFLGIVGGPQVPDLSNLAGRPLDDVIPPIDAIIKSLQTVRQAVPVP